MSPISQFLRITHNQGCTTLVWTGLRPIRPRLRPNRCPWSGPVSGRSPDNRSSPMMGPGASVRSRSQSNQSGPISRTRLDRTNCSMIVCVNQSFKASNHTTYRLPSGVRGEELECSKNAPALQRPNAPPVLQHSNAPTLQHSKNAPALIEFDDIMMMIFERDIAPT
jgi:hypothetical protein